MLKRLSVLIAASLLSTAAFAQDGDWSGWHVGLTAGHASGDSEADVALSGAWTSETQALQDHVTDNWGTDDLDTSGSTYGITFGYDHQFASGFILGGELDYNKLNGDDTRSTGFVPTAPFPTLSYNFGNAVEVDSQLSLRLKLGYGMDRHQFYGTLGATQVDAEFAAAVASNGNYLKAGVSDEKLDGIQYGVGYGFSFNDNWSLRAEYLRTNTSDAHYDTIYLPGSSFVTPAYNERVSQDIDFDTFRIGVDFRF
jgi:opacity protein-like surface antigen